MSIVIEQHELLQNHVKHSSTMRTGKPSRPSWWEGSSKKHRLVRIVCRQSKLFLTGSRPRSTAD
jgi:hypothetical protein